jgi:hypothetical protein
MLPSRLFAYGQCVTSSNFKTETCKQFSKSIRSIICPEDFERSRGDYAAAAMVPPGTPDDAHTNFTASLTFTTTTSFSSFSSFSFFSSFHLFHALVTPLQALLKQLCSLALGSSSSAQVAHPKHQNTMSRTKHSFRSPSSINNSARTCQAWRK